MIRSKLCLRLLMINGLLLACTPEATKVNFNQPIDQQIQDRNLMVLPQLDMMDVDPNRTDMSLLGEYGDSCELSVDCASGYCIETDQGKICSKLCIDALDCASDRVFDLGCGLLSNSGSDALLICIPAKNDLCKPCEADLDCGQESTNNLCLPIGRGNYCARTCDDRRPCPMDYECQTMMVEGLEVKQCMPASGYCAGCMDTDGDGYGMGGDCLGIDCDENDPNVNEGGVEICDNRDNNCNFQVDENLVLPSDLCKFVGACAAANPVCFQGVWDCGYPIAVENVDAQETRCDLVDNDCDGLIDEHVDLNTDEMNCGVCGVVCSFANAQAVCSARTCMIDSCLDGFVDLNQDRRDGCEYACTKTAEIDVPDVDHIDANCDGIDGMKDLAIYVDVEMGNDNLDGHTIYTPVRSISVALSKASTEDRDIYISHGTYFEIIELLDGVNLYGGYDASAGWQRQNELETLVIGINNRGITARNISSATEIQQIHFKGEENLVAGGSSYGAVIVNSSSELIFRNCVIEAGRGGDGRSGIAGQSGLGASGGRDGQDAQDSELFAGCGTRVGGSGGTNFCSDFNPNGGNGGNGGVGDQNGGAGNTGLPNPGNGGRGGNGGNYDNDCRTQPGGQAGSIGVNGSNGAEGVNGNGGNGRGEIRGEGWFGQNGGSGQNGISGGGGGGGGGSGGQNGRYIFPITACDDGCGGGGGGGGAGGCGGSSATGGQAGGGSIGVLLINSSPRLDQNMIITGGGGIGGNGGRGGDGGVGARGGNGGPANGDLSSGGMGGFGGNGGRGGHGGGGAGGISVGIFLEGSALPDGVSNRYSIGAGGQGGLSPTIPGTPGTPGTMGVSAEVF